VRVLTLPAAYEAALSLLLLILLEREKRKKKEGRGGEKKGRKGKGEKGYRCGGRPPPTECRRPRFGAFSSIFPYIFFSIVGHFQKGRKGGKGKRGEKGKKEGERNKNTHAAPPGPSDANWESTAIFNSRRQMFVLKLPFFLVRGKKERGKEREKRREGGGKGGGRGK